MRIVPLEARHASELQRLVRDPRVAIPAGLPASIPDSWAAGYIEARASAWRQGRACTFAVVPTDGEQLLGVCSLIDVCWEVRRAELAFFVDRLSWGRGYGRGAAEMVVHFAFERLDLCVLHARALPGNRRARRILLGCGFHEMRLRPVPEGHPRRDAATMFRLDQAAILARSTRREG
jgi:RimJ/RimL family protein N-acetyltransferase